jgi:hypothetical protein
MKLCLAVLEGIDYTLSYMFVEEPPWTGGGFIQCPIYCREGFTGGLVLDWRRNSG